MTWLKLDDKFPEHRKIRRLNDGAYRLHTTAMAACSKDETDGLVTMADLDEMTHSTRLQKYVPALVEAGLWDVVPGGWMIHDFLDYNPSHADLNAKRDADRQRQQRLRDARDARSHGKSNASVSDRTPDRTPNPDETPSEDGVSQRDSRVSHSGVTHVSQHPVPSRPVPSRPEQTRASANKRGTRLSPDFIPAEQTRATILAECPSVDLMREDAKFVDYWAAQPNSKGIKVDWDATWRNWMRRAGETSTRANGRQRETDDLFGRAMARANARDIAAGIQPTELLAIEGNVL